MDFDLSCQHVAICSSRSNTSGMSGFGRFTLTILLAVSISSGTHGQSQDSAQLESTEVATDEQRNLFEQDVAPILREHCLECHAGAEPDGGLDLTSLELLMQGGESGPALSPASPESSLIWLRVSQAEMPPDEPLTDSQQQALKQWIADGANWSGGPLERNRLTTSTRAGSDWWSLQPLSSPLPPTLEDPRWTQNPIDAFILQKLHEHGLTPAPPATNQQLIRRLYIDLIGTPPKPEEIAEFTAAPSEENYQRVVERLLASPLYGERWGRHWLDVVRFGESDGFERNYPRDNAWYYRDWVIQALNQGMPYDQFVRMQLIGDLEEGGAVGAAATGFWTAGVHNTVVGGSRRMQDLARQDEIEDVVGTIGQTFLGLTLNCARCHDHKFDPISIEEYYSLASAISGLGFGERTVESQEDAEKLSNVDKKIEQLTSQLHSIDQQAIEALKQQATSISPDPLVSPGVVSPSTSSIVPLASWDFEGDLRDSQGMLEAKSVGSPTIEAGALVLDGRSYVVTPPLTSSIASKTLEAWVQLDDLVQQGGAAMSLQSLDGSVFDAIVFGEQQSRRWMAGSNSFVRTAPFANEDAVWNEAAAVEEPIHIAMVYHADGSIECFRNGQRYGGSIRRSPAQVFESGQCNLLFGLRHEPGTGNRFLRGKLHRVALYDKALTPAEIEAAYAVKPHRFSEDQLLATMSSEVQQVRGKLQREIASLRSIREQHAQSAVCRIYTLTPGVGQQVQLLRRGDPDMPGPVVAPGGLKIVAAEASDFMLPNDAAEGDRRRKLADWITSSHNPLFARVIVNRVWHYHFGTGLVDTPNDFGFNGGRPSHPELLDHLASRFERGGYRLKDLHRWIVSSNTYRQTSIDIAPEAIEAAERVDSENRLLWRSPVRRLEAETLRDAMLATAGELNLLGGGPSFRDVSVTENSGTTYYEPLDISNAETWRRTVYRFNPRGGRSALLDTFDCPDPAAAAPRRAVTTTPLQALSLLNNSFVLIMSEALAQRVAREAGTEAGSQIEHAWELTLGRKPTRAEADLSRRLYDQHGLPAVCRGLFNLSEFVMY